MTVDLRVRLHQWASDLEPRVNRERLASGVSAAADLIVFPEAFARDFREPGSDVSPFAETLSGPFATEVTDRASSAGTTVLAGMFEQSADPQRPYNTVLVAGAASTAYRKIHLFDSFGYRESDRLSSGALTPVVFDVNGWRIGLLTCYDLRFPELARRLVEEGAEVLVVPAAWLPGPGKVQHWRTLLSARAIENTVYVVGVGQPAPRYCGNSLVIGPLGEVVAEAGAEQTTVEATLVRASLASARRTNPSLANRRM